MDCEKVIDFEIGQNYISLFFFLTFCVILCRYASEVALRQEYEQRLATLSPTSVHSPTSAAVARERSEQQTMNDNISNVYLIPTLTGMYSFPPTFPPFSRILEEGNYGPGSVGLAVQNLF